MALTADEISAVRTSFARVLPVKRSFGKDFYIGLFAAAPEARDLFPAQMSRQRDKLVSMLAYVVKHLDDGEALMDQALPLARRHVGYGAEPVHYALVGEVLVQTLKSYGVDAAEEQAWRKAYGVLSGAMIAAAQDMPPRDEPKIETLTT
ncbi:MAG: globin domain-containing protein [Pseudomonadota bacterium]